MKNKVLWKTNFLICIILIIGFALTFILSYRANYSAAQQNIEHVSTLTSEGIYYQMHNTLSKPVNVSLTMANDSLLKEALKQEAAHPDSDLCMEKITNYLDGYRKAYDYDSVFLVSSATSRYYNFNGMDRILIEGEAENKWYYDGLLHSEEEYSMNVDNDEVEGAGNAITLFVNCKIRDDAGELLGVVGVGVQIDYLQGLLEEYYEEFGVNAYFIDDTGLITLSAEYSGYEKQNLFENDGYIGNEKNKILNWKKDTDALEFWEKDGVNSKKDYIVVRYLSDISWHLIVESNTDSLVTRLQTQFILTVLVIAVLIAVILLITTHVIGNFNQRIVDLMYMHEQERKSIFEKATEQLFENIYELDITHNCPANKETEDYFIRHGAPVGATFDQSLKIIAEKQIWSEFRKDYLDTFSTKNVLRSFQNGVDSLRCDFMITEDGEHYHWMRVIAKLVISEADGSLHMLTYRQNIDKEKKREQKMKELARTDEMTKLLNKGGTQRKIKKMLAENPDQKYAFFIFDIDRFKDANDCFGHAFGDSIIRKFASILREAFQENDCVGRIGGDEFVAFVEVTESEEAIEKAYALREALDVQYEEGSNRWHMSASIGIAFAPKDGKSFEELYQHADMAMYQSKKRERGSFTLYGKTDKFMKNLMEKRTKY